MMCYYHPDIESVKICSTCSRSLCQSCAHTIKGRVLCKDCLVAGAQFAAVASSPRFANYSPGRAALFSVIPGIGAVYNQQYVKAVQHFAVFAALVTIADRGPEIFGFAAFAFWVFQIIDAYRSAQAIIKRASLQPGSAGEKKTEVNVPIWGGVLVILGTIFFLDNLNMVRLDRMLDYAWPLLFVAAGLYLIFDFYHKDRSQPEAAYVPATPGYSGPGAEPSPAPSPPPAPQTADQDSPQTEAETGQDGESAPHKD